MSENRETANTDMHQAIPGLVTDIASGRAEDSIFVHKKVALCATFCEQRKSTMLPQANRATTGRKRPVCRPTA
jgi:hypothetical protein